MIKYDELLLGDSLTVLILLGGLAIDKNLFLGLANLLSKKSGFSIILGIVSEPFLALIERILLALLVLGTLFELVPCLFAVSGRRSG